MRNPPTWPGLLVGLCALAAGCGPSREQLLDEETEAYAQPVLEQIKVQDEVTEILAKIQKPSDMPEGRKELQRCYPLARRLAQKNSSLQPPSAAVSERLKQAYGERFRASWENMNEQ